MIPEPFLPGYLIYLAFIFLPGIGFGELFGIWKLAETLAERLALSFGLGLAVDTVVMLAKTSGIEGMKGIDATTVYFTIGLGLIALIVSIAVRRKFVLPVRPRRIDFALFLIVLIQGAMLLLYFQKYPIFPQYQSQDFGNHVNYVLGLISGSTLSIPTGLLYFGVHYQLAGAFLLVGGEPLVTIQRTIAILITVSPLIFYVSAKRIFSSSRVGLVTATVYALSGSIWYSGPLDSGLYPNFFGILAVLFLLVTLYYVIESPRSIAFWLLFLLATVNMYMSHYTALTILPPLLFIPMYQLIIRKTDAKRYIAPVLVAIVPAGVQLFIFPHLANYIFFLAESGGGVIGGRTAISNALSTIPVLQYLAVEINNDVEFVALFILLTVYLYLVVKKRSALMLFPIAWFLSLLIAAPQSVSAWRYSYETIIPLMLMACYGATMVLPGAPKTKTRDTIRNRIKGHGNDMPLLRITLFVLLMGATLVNADGQQIMSNALTQTSLVSNSQVSVYSSVYWLKDNTPNNSTYLSVSDARFEYTTLLIGRSTYYTYIYEPTTALLVAKNLSAQYIIVTYVATALVANKSFFAWNNFPNSTTHSLKMVYTSSDVRIYQIIS